MSTLLKHIGRYGEKPCIVVFRELPNDQDSCLIVQTETLERVMHDDLMSVITSVEAQSSNDVSQVLHRRQFSDGSNMINTLHYSKRMQKVPVNMVWLVPAPGQNIPLEAVNAEVRKINSGYVPPKTDGSHLSEAAKPAPVPTPDSLSTAQNLLFQAKLMEEDAQGMLREAQSKMQEAYRLDPSLVPAAAQSVELTTISKKTTKRTTKKSSVTK
jgi:hypothetical protein